MNDNNESPRILIYSQDGFGLGHLRRNLNISLQIKKMSAAASVLILADSPVAPFFKLPPCCDFVKLPTIVKVDTGVWRSNRLSMSYKDILKIRSQIIQDVAITFRPHVFLVDHMPHGALGELDQPLKELKATHKNTKIVLGLRDILGSNDVIHNMWVKEGAFAAIEQFYDDICIYGNDNVFDLIKEYSFPESIARKSQYCGYVARDSNGEDAIEEVMKSDSQNDEKLLLITGGGGADASYFMDMFIDAFRSLGEDYNARAILSTGPFMQDDQIKALQSKAAGLKISIESNAEDSIEDLINADLVISMAGYNTVSELMHYRKNAIIIPRPGPSAEQTMRTDIFTKRGVFRSIYLRDIQVKKFAEMIHEKLSDGIGMDESQLPNLNGAANVAEVLLERCNTN